MDIHATDGSGNSAWLSFGSDSANGAGGASAPADSDASDFSKFQRLQEEKKVRDQTDAEVCSIVVKTRIPLSLNCVLNRRLNGWKKSVLLQNCDGKRLLNSSDFNANGIWSLSIFSRLLSS